MLALLAFIAFLVGLIVRLVNAGFEFTDVWIWLLLGLTLLSADRLWPTATPWRRRDDL